MANGSPSSLSHRVPYFVLTLCLAALLFVVDCILQDESQSTRLKEHYQTVQTDAAPETRTAAFSSPTRPSVSTKCSTEAYVTLVHSNAPPLLTAAKLLAYSLRTLHQTQRDMVVMVTPHVTASVRDDLEHFGYIVKEVPAIANPEKACKWFKEGLFRFNDPKTNTPFAKLNVWDLTEYEKAVFLDVTTHVPRSLDELFWRPGYPISAPNAISPSNWFSSSLMVLNPSRELFIDMLKALPRIGAPDCTEMSFLNMFFPTWFTERGEHLLPPHIYQESHPKTLFRLVSRSRGTFEFRGSGELSALRYMDHHPGSSGMPWPWTKQKALRSVMKEFWRKARDAKMEGPRTCLVIPYANTRSQASLSSGPCLELDSSLQFIINGGVSHSPPKSSALSIPGKYAYVTFIQNTEERFIQSAEVLISSLRAHTRVRGRDVDLVAMVTPFVDPVTRSRLRLVGYTLRDIESIKHPISRCQETKWASATDGNSELAKLRMWELEEYEKIVYLDVDLLILQDISDLFSRPGKPLSAAHGMYPPFEFNAGVMVINPSKRVFEDMIAKLPDLGSHDCGDQGFLNKYFEIWRDLPSPHHLPNSYNIHVRMLSRLVSNSDIQRNFFNTLDPKILHFSGRFKPWEPSQEIVVDNLALSELWSTTFRNAHPEITRAMITRRQTILNKKQIEIVESLGEILRGVSQMSDLSSLPVAFLGGPRVDEFEDVVHFLGELSALRRLGLEPEIHCVFNHLPTAPSCDLNVLRESIPSDAIVFVHTSFSGASQHQRSASGNTFLLNVTNFFLNHKIVAMDSRSSSSNPTKAHETMERTITDLVQAVESHPALYLIWSDDVAFHSSAASFPSRRSYLLKYLPLLLDVNDTDGPNRNPVDVMTSSSLQNRKVFQEPLVKIRDSKPKRDLSHLDLDTLQNDSDDESKRLREHLEKRDDDREVREGTEEPKTDREQEKDEEQYEVKGDESKGLEIIWSVEYLDTESILSQSLKDVIASLAQSTFMANGTVHPFVVKTMIQRLQQAFRQVVSRMSRAQVWVASDLTTTMLAATLGKPLVILAENDEADIVKRVPFVKDVLNDDDAVFVSLDAREQASVLFNNIIKAFY